MYNSTDNLITEAPAQWLTDAMDAEPRHAGSSDVINVHEHASLQSIFDCTDNLCVSLLTPDSGRVQYIGKHGVSYARKAA